MNPRLRIILISVAALALAALLVGGFIWLRSRDVGVPAPVITPPPTTASGNGTAATTTGEQVTPAQQAILNELSKAPKDSDGDLLPDDQETAKGTDPNNPDTDGDGLLDGSEIQNGKDPLKADERRAVPEAPAPTPPPTATTTASTPKDSDGDGLTDDQEKVYQTDPNKADSDGDGYLDGQEVKTGYNPLGPGKCKNATCTP